MTDRCPRVRPGLIVRSIGHEIVIYDPTSHRAHCLNRTAAIVLRAIDGRSGISALAARLAVASGTEADERLTHDALECLAEAGLLDETGRSSSPMVSRRRAMRRLGLGAAVLAPVVVSLLVPVPAEAAATCVQAASCGVSDFGTPCYVSSQAECVNKTCTGNPGECL